MIEVPIYKKSQIDTRVQYGAGGAGIIREQANANERLQARLQGNIQEVVNILQPQIKKETQKQAIEDVKAGKIDSKSVALVAQDIYKKTAESSFFASVEVGSKDLGNRLVNEQILSGKYDVNAINSSWSNYIKGTTGGIKDITVKSNIENRLNKMGQQFQSQVGTLQTSQQRGMQEKNLRAKLEMDKEELKKATGVNPTRTVELQSEIANTIWTLGSANFITPIEAEILHTSINKEAYVDHSQRQFKLALSQGLESAEKFIEKFDKSKQPLLDEKEKITTKNSYESQVSDLKRDNNNAITSVIKGNTIDIDAGIRILNSGKVPANKIVLDEKIKTLPEKKQKAYKIATIIQSERAKFSNLSLLEEEAFINSSEAKKISDIYGVEVLDEVKKVIAKKLKLAKSDSFSLAIQDNLFKQPKAVTITDLTPLPERLILSAIVTSQYGTIPKLLTNAETNNFINFMADPTVTINQKQQIIAKINGNGTEIAEIVYRQIGGKRAYNFAFAGELAFMGNTQASKLALQGRNADITLDTDLNLKFQQKLNGVFNNFTAEFYNQNLQGLKDYTKGLMLTGQDVDADDVLENTIGKSVKYNGKQTILPYSVNQSDFEEWLDNINIPKRPGLSKGLQDLTDTVYSGGYQLHYKSPGKYLVQFEDKNGDRAYAKTDDGESLFILDWNE